MLDAKCTPEHAIWFAVLGTYVTDLSYVLPELAKARARHDRKAFQIHESRVERLLEMAEHPWTEEICELIDFDHSFFVAGLKKMVERYAPKKVRKSA